jgi:O-antigen ligase
LIIIMTVPPGLDYQNTKGMATSADAFNRFLWLLLLFGGFANLMRQFARTKALLMRTNPYFLGFLVFATASLVWSIAPDVTTLRLLRAFTISMVCFGFVLDGWRPHRFQNVLRPVLAFILIASLIFVIADPEDAIHHSMQVELRGTWRGITLGKNILGSLASVSVVLWLHAWMSKQSGALISICGIALSAFLLIKTRSATSLMATVFAVTFMLILLRSPGSLRRYMPYLVGTFAAVILVYCLAVLRLVPHMEFLLEPISMLTGKDLTFSGRTQIWEVLNEHIRQSPWIGSGYGAYWIGLVPGSPSVEMMRRLYFYPTEGHNGYLDVINDLGAVGGFILLGYFAAYVRQSLKMLRFDRYQGGLYLTLLFRGFIADMSESHWFLPLTVDFVLMTLATAALARGLIQNEFGGAAAQPAAVPRAGAQGLRPRQPPPMRGRRGVFR